MRHLLATAAASALVVAAVPALVGEAPLADAVLVDGHILTVDAHFTVAEALAVRGDRVLAVGSTSAIAKLAGPHTVRIDLGGRTVVPGLADGHLHSAGGGPGVDLSQARSLDEVLAAIAAKVRASRPGDLIVSNSDWHEGQLKEQRLPLRRDLDRVAPHNPVVLVRGGHEYILNSAALAKWGIDERTPEVPGGRISRYADGTLNGELVDRAKSLVTLPAPPPKSLEARLADLQAEFARLHAAGLTSVRLAGISAEQYRLLEELQRRGRLTMRVRALLRPEGELTAGGVLRTLDTWGLRPEQGDEWLRVVGVKLGVDGGFEGGWMHEPYAEPWGEGGRYRGLNTLPADRYTAIVRALNRSGWRVATHAVGDAAIDEVLAAYEAADADRPLAGRRWSIEHAFIARPDQIARMQRLGLVVSVQHHLYLAGPSLVKYWGRPRAAQTTPLRAFVDAGLVIAAGTDSPVVSYRPFTVIYHFVTRDTITGGVMGAEHRIDRREALAASTINNAYLTFEEQLKGSLEPGKLADLVVLSDDPLTVPEQGLLKLGVLMTMVGGKVVYQDPAFQTSR
jgi:predicted amidohydrolase YtcJ